MLGDKKLITISFCLLIISPIFTFLISKQSPLALLLLVFWLLVYLFGKKSVASCFFLLVFLMILGNFLTKDFAVVFSQRKIAMRGEIETQRGECLKVFNPFVCRVFYNKLENFFSHFFGNFLSLFSLNFLFLDASSASDFAYPKKGIFYFWELPLFLVGLSRISAKKARKYLFFIVFPMLISSLFSPGEILPFIFALPFVLFIESLGWLKFGDFFRKD